MLSFSFLLVVKNWKSRNIFRKENIFFQKQSQHICITERDRPWVVPKPSGGTRGTRVPGPTKWKVAQEHPCSIQQQSEDKSGNKTENNFPRPQRTLGIPEGQLLAGRSYDNKLNWVSIS